MILYSGLEVLGTEWHITTMYAPLKPTGRITTDSSVHTAKIIDVVYWEHVDLTVALVESEFATSCYNKWVERGFDMEFDSYVPHITVGKGDQTETFHWMKGSNYQIGREYVRIK